MCNEYELALDNRQELIYTKEQLMAPLLPGMEAPPHPMRLGDDEKDYYTVESQAPLQQGAPQSAANVAGKPITGHAIEVGRHHADERRSDVARRAADERAGAARRGDRVLDPRPDLAGRRDRHGAAAQRRSTRRCRWWPR